jgi:hypothetical protein
VVEGYCNHQALDFVLQTDKIAMQTFIPQPRSPAQLALVGALIWLVGALVHLSLLAPIGIALLLLAGIGQLIRPRSHEMYWRGRRIQLDDDRSVAHRIYRAVFRE